MPHSSPARARYGVPFVILKVWYICQSWSMQHRVMLESATRLSYRERIQIKIRNSDAYEIKIYRPFVRGINRWPVDSLHKRPVTRKAFHIVTSSLNASGFRQLFPVPLQSSAASCGGGEEEVRKWRLPVWDPLCKNRRKGKSYKRIWKMVFMYQKS